MARRVFASLYFAADKDVYDLLSSTKKKASKAFMLDFARGRGIFLSKEDDREQLVDYLSILPYDLNDRDVLIDQAQTSDRAEKLTTTSISSPASAEDLFNASVTLQSERSDRFSETYAPTSVGPNMFKLTVDYTEFDFSRTRLRQKRDREVVIECEIDRTSGKINIRHQANERAEEIVNAYIDKLAEQTGDTRQQRRISLTGLTTSHARTAFFTGLINNMSGYRLQDVTNVKVDRRIDTEEIEDAEGQEDSLESYREESETMLGIVRQVALEGAGLLYSTEYQNLAKSGFYICSVTWKSQEEIPESPIVEFQALLGNPAAGTGFKYAVKGIYSQTKSGEYTLHRRTPKPLEKMKYLRAIEAAAWNTLDQLEPNE